MKKLWLLCVFFLAAFVAGAQKVYFIYIEADNGAPFYVRMGDKVNSSTSAGYLILANLRDSSYLLQVGFAGGSAESRFQVTINHEDKGFVLKQMNGAWNLFDLQSLTLLKSLASDGPSAEEGQRMLAMADPFTQLLARASNDLSLLSSGPSAPAAEASVAQVRTNVPADTIPSKKATAATAPDTSVVASATHAPDTAVIVQAAAEMPPVVEAAFARSVVTRRSESSTTEGFGLVFVDNLGASTDTIRLLIPNPREAVAVTVNTPAESVKPSAAIVKDSASVPPAAVAVNAGPPVPDPAPAASPAKDSASAIGVVDSVKGVHPVASPAPAARVNQCAAVADDHDFFKLRKNMAAASDEAAMVRVARKDFNKRCYTSLQLRNLAALFLTDLAKYNFLEAAYEHVTDPAQFEALGTDLKDSYYADRFKAMLAH